MKPHLQIIAGRPVAVDPTRKRIDEARRRFGRPFAHEAGTNWRPRDTLYLTVWLAERMRAKT